MEQGQAEQEQEPVVAAGKHGSSGESRGEAVILEQSGSDGLESSGDDTLEDASMRFFGGAGDGDQPPTDQGAAGEPSLEEQLQTAISESEAHRNAHLRTMAEMQNMRKRFEREGQQARQYAIEGFARDLLTVADNLERALAAVPAECSPDLKMFQEGVAMTQNELTRALGKHGVTRVKALHEPFDPNLHQGVLQVEEADALPGTVVREMQAGYLLNGRLLRPAMVGVAKEPEQAIEVVAET